METENESEKPWNTKGNRALWFPEFFVIIWFLFALGFLMGLSSLSEAEKENVEKVCVLIMFLCDALIYRTFWNHRCGLLYESQKNLGIF